MTPIIDLHPCIQGEGKLAGVPHILIRTAGCNLRCMFKNSTCDTPHSSFKPEKGSYSFEDIYEMVKVNSQIRNILLTGGEPCLHPTFINRILQDFGHHVVTIETNGTLFPGSEIAEQVDLVSMSPKLISSIPSEAKAKSLNIRYNENNELRHIAAISEINPILNWILYARDYQLKYVIGDHMDIVEVLDQLDHIRENVNVPNSKVYLMPAGTLNSQLQETRAWLMEECIRLGFNYTDRLQIIAYGDKRGV